MVRIKFKDGSEREFSKTVLGCDVAKHVSENSSKEVVLCKVDGIVHDLNTSIDTDAAVDFLTIQSLETIGVLRHSTAHVVAKAVKELFPEAKMATGPATEDGFFYDFETERPFTPEDLNEIEKKIGDIVARDIAFERIVMERTKAIGFFEELGESFKVELLKSIEDQFVTLYKLDDLYDLCRGPHLPSTKFIGNAFKITKSSGAYWKGDKDRESLQRVYGTVWPTQKELETYFVRLEEAEKRDHRKIGVALDLFHVQDISPGAVFWHTKGWTLYRILKNFVRARMEEDGYQEVNTPMILDRILWEKSGHWEKYRENMFITETQEERVMAVKPMNCPCHVQIFNRKVVSYKDLPWRIAEFGSCHRYEPSGALHGIMRVRGFVQDDAHIFCRPEQIVDETKKFCNLLRGIYKDLGFTDFFVKFSDRPEKRAGDDSIWDIAERSLKEAAEISGLDYVLNPGEGAFYGPKLEFVLKDCLGRDWQCGTFQVDFVIPERLGAQYVAEDGSRQVPVMLHRAVLGSLERFIGILIEHYAGGFPVWLAPVQVVIATITDEAIPLVQEFFEKLRACGVRAEMDLRNEKISYKIREHSEQKIPYMLIVGKSELQSRKVSVRTFGTDISRELNIEEFIKEIKEKSAEYK
jgi:threonyl-tRNA synthetase